MKYVPFIFLFLWINTELFAHKPIVQRELDELVIYSIPVAQDRGNTTFLFPAPISALYASKTAPQSQQNTDAEFLISFEPGNSFFAVRALKETAEDYLTVIYKRKSYVIRIKADKQPHYTVTFYSADSNPKGEKSAVPPERLISLLDKAKLYPDLEKHEPDALAGVEHAALNRISYYQRFRVYLRDVWRFEEEDTLVFHVELENKNDEPIFYSPQDLAVRVKDRIYTSSISDASGIVPGKSTVPAYFAITGNPRGGRNHLSPDNQWNVLVAEIATPAALTSGDSK